MSISSYLFKFIFVQIRLMHMRNFFQTLLYLIKSDLKNVSDMN